MFALRLYVAALTLLLAAAFVCTAEVGLQHCVVTAGPLLYMILEMRDELREMKTMETRISTD